MQNMKLYWLSRGWCRRLKGDESVGVECGKFDERY